MSLPLVRLLSNKWQGEIKMYLARWLVQQRKLKKLSKEQLAQHLNKPTSYINDVEQGRHMLEIIEFLKYCHVLNVDTKIAIEIIQKQLQNNVETKSSGNDDFS